MSDDYQAVKDIPVIYLNTDDLRTYADRLSSVLASSEGVEKRLEDLFRMLGNATLINVSEAYLREGNERGLRKCIHFLNETADAFETAEIIIKDTK